MDEKLIIRSDPDRLLGKVIRIRAKEYTVLKEISVATGIPVGEIASEMIAFAAKNTVVATENEA